MLRHIQVHFQVHLLSLVHFRVIGKLMLMWMVLVLHLSVMLMVLGQDLYLYIHDLFAFFVFFGLLFDLCLREVVKLVYITHH